MDEHTLPPDLPRLPDDWAWRPLATLTEPNRGVSYGIVQPGSHDPAGVPILRADNVRDGYIQTDVVLRVAQVIERGYQRSRLHGGEVVLTLVGAYFGKAAIIPDRFRGWNVARAVAVIPVVTGLEPQWLVSCLRSPVVQHYIRNWATTTAQPTLNLRDVARLPIPMPPRDERIRISHVLSAIDEKIELSQRMNETLEATARALFRSWFVDFDPVRAKAEGRDTGLPKHLADIFPDSFEDTGLGKIPKGWRIGKLGGVLSVVETGGRPRGGVRDITEGVPSVGAESIVGIGHFDYSKTRFVPRDFFANMNKGHVQDYDVLLYKDGGRPGVYEPHLTVVGDGFPFTEFCINEHVYRLRTEPTLPQSYLFFYLSSDSAMEEMRTRGTGVAIPGLNSTAVRELAVLEPSVPALEAFENSVSPIVRRLLL